MNKKRRLSCGILKHLIIYLILLSALIGCYYFIYRDVNPGCSTPDIIASVIQNAISAGLLAVSIALPITAGLMGYSMKNKKSIIYILFSACLFFFISLLAALWNFFRLPGLVTRLNIANDFQTAVFQIIQLFSLISGFFCLIIGAYRILKFDQ